jgi:hypothetical protein
LKTYQFITILSAKGDLTVPKRILRHLDKQRVRVILLADETDQETEDWSKLSMEHFLEGYAPQDSIYDNL